MNLIYLKAAIIIINLLYFCSCSMPLVAEPDYLLRPITIKIIEEKTSKPVPGIQVLHVFETEIYGSCWSMFKHMCPDSNYTGRLAVTNEFGIVTFKQHVYDFTCNEYPDSEYLIINLALRPDAYEKNTWISEDEIESLMQSGIRPNQNYRENIKVIDTNYRGKIIYGQSFEIKAPNEWWKGDFGFFDVEVNKNGFSGGPENVVTTLRKQRVQ